MADPAMRIVSDVERDAENIDFELDSDEMKAEAIEEAAAAAAGPLDMTVTRFAGDMEARYANLADHISKTEKLRSQARTDAERIIRKAERRRDEAVKHYDDELRQMRAVLAVYEDARRKLAEIAG